MSKPFPKLGVTKENVTKGVRVEIDGLCAIAELDIFPKLLKYITDYEHFISVERNHIYAKKKIQKIFNNGVLDQNNKSLIIREIYCTSHLIACCELLKGTTLDITALNRNTAATLTDNILKFFNNNYYEIDYRLHTIDAVRTMQILRIMGLITKPVKNIRQLSLGAADGMKDIRAIHLLPSFQKVNSTAISSKSAIDTLYKFDVIEQHAEDIIIVDGDPTRKEAYEQFNNDSSHNVLAINNDSMPTLKELPGIMQRNQLPLRDLVVGLRVEHRMIPSVKDFFRALKNSIADISDLIITIGSGQSLEDFDGRTSLLKNMFSELTQLGMKPVIIKLHGQGSLEQQYQDHKFGLAGITTYQILYCKLKKKLLKKI